MLLIDGFVYVVTQGENMNIVKREKSLETYNTMPVSKAVIQNILPAIVSMLMVLIYNLADTFFIGKTGDAYQVVAVSLATPVFLLFMAVGTVFGIGGTSVISRAIGRGEKDYAKSVCAFCMWSCIFIGLVLSVLFLIFMDLLLRVIGASKNTWAHTKTYLMIVGAGGVCSVISSCFSNVLRAEGKAAAAMTGQILGNALNIILDPLFILGFSWDIAGAAWATVIGQAAAAVYYIFCYTGGKSELGIHIRDVRIKNGICAGVLAIGVPAALGSLLMSLSQIIMNSLMAEHGDLALAGIGVAMKIIMITGMICMGVGQGVQPLLGYCVGAKDDKRFKEIMRFSLFVSAMLAAVMTALCYLFTNEIAGAFLTNSTALEYAVIFSRILLSTSASFGIFYVLLNALQAMGEGVSSLIINVSRQGLIYIPALFVLHALLGMNGLAWAQPAADILAVTLAVILFLKTIKKIKA